MEKDVKNCIQESGEHMKKLWNNKLVKNKNGQVRSGWIVLAVMAAYYLIMYVLSFLLIEAMRKNLISTGDINEATGELSAYVNLSLIHI